MALQRQMTIKELFLETILDSYHKLNSLGLIRNPYPKQSEEFFHKLLAGRVDIQIIAWYNLQCLEGRQVDTLNDEDFIERYNNFLQKEIKRICSKNKCLDIFKDFRASKDEFEKLQKEMTQHFEYKFSKTRKEMILNRLEIASMISLFQGPLFIQVLLEKIKFQKLLFVLELEQG